MKIKVALITNTINRAGGAELTTVTMFRALRNVTNFDVYVMGREKLDKGLLERWVDTQLIDELEKRYIILRNRLKALRELLGFDLVINTRSNEVLLPAHIHYLHWIFSPLGIKDVDALTYYRRAYNVNNVTIRHIVRHIAHYLNTKFSKLILANSRYTAELLKEVGINAKVLYPPVKSREIMQDTSRIGYGNREKMIVTVSRIDSGKQLELIPLIASKIKEAKFILIGSLADRNYFSQLLKLKSRLKAENFLIFPDLNRDKLYELLGKAMIYLHTAHHEQFGIAVVEGMAAGCIPVVHRSGGPYIDILDEKEGVYGFSYKELEEAIAVIKDLIYDSQRWKEVSERARQRSLLFDESYFSIKIINIVKDMLR